MNGDVCESCGSHQVRAARVAGFEVEQCDLCGHVQGDEEQVAQLATHREAEARGIDPEIYALVQAIERVPTFRIDQASAGRAQTAEYPFVFLRVLPGGLPHLERLLTSIEMANHHTRRRWVIECTLQHGLLFILRPRFWKPVLEIQPSDVREARGDLPILARAIARDVQMAWWKQ